MQNLIENVVVIPPQKLRATERQQQVNHALAVPPAIHVIARKNEPSRRIPLLDFRQNRLQRIKHSVNITNNPVHQFFGTISLSTALCTAQALLDIGLAEVGG